MTLIVSIDGYLNCNYYVDLHKLICVHSMTKKLVVEGKSRKHCSLMKFIYGYQLGVNYNGTLKSHKVINKFMFKFNEVDNCLRMEINLTSTLYA